MMTVIGWTTMGRVRAFLVFVVSMLAFACSHSQSIRVDGFGSKLASGCSEWTGCTGLVGEAETRVAKCRAEEDSQAQCNAALNDLRIARFMQRQVESRRLAALKHQANVNESAARDRLCGANAAAMKESFDAQSREKDAEIRAAWAAKDEAQRKYERQHTELVELMRSLPRD